jgi:hypothetical protein
MQWGALLLQSRDRAGFLRLLAELGSARRVPSYLIQWGLEWGLSGGDREMIERARLLAPRMLAYVPENRRAVERLLQKLRTNGMPPSP